MCRLIYTSISLLLLITLPYSQSGTWRFAPVVGALKVGPTIDSGQDWSSDEDAITTRACLFDDEYIFHEDGTFENVLGESTWLEPWQGVAEGCGAPIAPHDGSNTGSWEYDSTAQTITITGVGNFLGLSKAITGGELTPGATVPESRTYNVMLLENGIMKVNIPTAGGYWTFLFAQEGVDLNVDITFSVDMTNENTHPDGVYIAGGNLGQEGYLMEDSDGDDIWQKTLSLPRSSRIQYKFRNRPSFNTWDGFEEAAGLAAGGCATGTYNDRYIDVPNVDTVLDTVCYAACVDCESLIRVDLTLAVNMADEETNPSGIWLAGGNFGQPGYPMSDEDGDDIWTITQPVLPNSVIKYKFVNGTISNWSGPWESVPDDCSVGEFDDRQIVVGEENVVADTVCFGKCTDCIENYPVDVTFNLDMNDVVAFDGSSPPFVFGSYVNWDSFTSQTFLSDEDGDNIYTGTVNDLMFRDSITFLYGYGSCFDCYETLIDGCGLYDNQNGLYVRQLPISQAGGDTVLILDNVKYEGCNTPRALFRLDASTAPTDEWAGGFSLCVTGHFNEWTDCGVELSDEDGDNIYTGIISNLLNGVDYEYKFLVDGEWGDELFESSAPPQSDCDHNPADNNYNYGFTARKGPEPLDLGLHPWNGCPPSAPSPPPPLQGAWKLSPIVGALKVGNAVNSSEWGWESSDNDITDRSCLFDDLFVFHESGSFENILGEETWIETWQGNSQDGCEQPVAPHDNSNNATWAYSNESIILNGVGAFIGIPKAINDGELTEDSSVPESRTYFIHSISPDSNSLIVYIPIHDNKYWTYTLIRDTGSLKTGANSLLPTNFIYRAYPNPFNPTINIYYELPIKDMVKIDIVNIVGQKIKTLTNKIHEPGKHSYLWGGKTTAGKEIQSGIYFAIITTSSKREVLKITYLK